MKYPYKAVLAIFIGFMTPLSEVLSFEGVPEPEVILPAPGYGELDFVAPKVGSYSLPTLGDAKNATAINTDGQSVQFHDLFKGKYTLLNFMYTRCNDINGCPLSHLVFSRIKALATQDPLIAENMQLISMSFDPSYDTPERLKALEGGGEHDMHDMPSQDEQHDQHAEHQSKSYSMDWKYLTTLSEEQLAPILESYGQSVMPQASSNGKDGGNFSHILRVFLIDPEMHIRNIYSVSFLHPDIIINDVKTLLMEFGTKAKIEANKHETQVRVGARDSKLGYESEDYVTSSLSIDSRVGEATDLMKFIETPPLGLPAVPIPVDNPITIEKVQLGRKLFYDRRLSLNNTISCAMCHIPEQGFTSHEVRTPVGFEGRTVRRNAPTIYNTAYLKHLFQDGRETSLEHQVWQPILAHNEMAMPSFGNSIEKIQKLDDYDGLFEAAFDGKGASFSTIPDAIASYERTLVSANSAFDRWYFAKEKNVISATAERGFKLFTGKANCISCHMITKDHALFTDNSLHNTGIGFERAMKKSPEVERVQVAPGRYMNVPTSFINSVGNEPIGDLGYYEVTQNPDDRWKYRTPSLRNVDLTAPYMHDGSLGDLTEVVEFYNKGGFKNETQSPLIKPLNLNKNEINEIVEFLKTLTGDNVAEIISDAFAAPIGDYLSKKTQTYEDINRVVPK
jgi:cytochrome c peroxidase